jgi:hypothetical protein
MIPFAFLGAKLLGMFPFLGFLRGIGGKLLLVGVVALGLFLGYMWWKKSIETEAVNRVFQEQVENHLKQQQEHLDTMEDVMKAREEAIQDFMQKQEKLMRNVRGLAEQIKNGQLKDGEIPEVLQRTLEDIRKLELNIPITPAPAPTLQPQLKPEVQP